MKSVAVQTVRHLQPVRAIGLVLLVGLGVLLAYSAEGGAGILSFALAFPAAIAVVNILRDAPDAPAPREVRPAETGLAARDEVVAALDQALFLARRSGRRTAAMVLEVEGWKDLEEQHSHADLEHILRVTANRL